MDILSIMYYLYEISIYLGILYFYLLNLASVIKLLIFVLFKMSSFMDKLSLLTKVVKLQRPWTGLGEVISFVCCFSEGLNETSDD